MKLLLKILFCGLLAVFFCLSINAQERFPVRLNEVSGMTMKHIYDVKQSADGFIWITGNEGLVRFDGFGFKAYSNPFMSSRSGSSIQIDDAGRVWYCNFDGEIYHTSKDSLQKADLPQNTALVFKIKGDTLWMVHKSVLMYYQISTRTTHKVATLPKFRTIHFNNDFIQLYDAIAATILLYHYDGSLKYKYRLTNNDFPRLLKVGDELLLASSDKKVVTIKTFRHDKFEHTASYPLNTAIANVVVRDVNISLCTKDGLLSYNTSAGVFEHTLAGKSVLSSFVDNQGNEWIAANEGIYYLSNAAKAWRYDVNGTAFCLHAIEKGLYVSDEKGVIQQFDKEAHRLVPVFITPNQQRVYQLFTSGRISEIQQLVNAYRAASDNVFQIGEMYNLVLNSGVKSIARLDEKYLSVAMSGSCDLVKIGADSIASIWDAQYEKYHPDADVVNAANLIHQVRGKSVVFDAAHSRLIFATNQGVKLFTPDTELELRYEGRPLYADKLLMVNDQCVVLSNMGDLYLLDAFNDLKKISQLSMSLPLQNIASDGTQLVVWNAHNIFVSNLDTLTVNTELGEFTNISSPLIPGDIQDIYLDTNQLFLIAGTQFLTLQLPVSGQIKKPLQLIPEKITSANEIYYFNNTITLPSDNKGFEFTFALLDFDHDVNELSYRLNDGEWKSLLPSDRNIQFVSIMPGDYTMQFKINGEVQEADIQFSKAKPWYNQWWFYLLVLSGIAAISYYYFSRRIRRQQMENALLLEKNQLENSLRQSLLSSIKAQMNPHFLFNALNTIQSYIITEDKENAARFLSMYSRLTRTILEMSDKEFVSLDAEITTINLYVELEKMRFPDIEYTLDIAADVNIYTVFIPSMIIQPFVENAIKHGLLHKQGNKVLQITCSRTETMLHIVIADNGIGREKSEQIKNKRSARHPSFAAHANLKRVELLSRNSAAVAWRYVDLKDAFGNATGTEVILKIPLNKIENDQGTHSR